MTLAPKAPTSAPASKPPGLRAILTPSWLGVITLAILFAGACWLILAPWQFGRHTDRDARNAQIETAMAAAAVPVTDLLSTAADPAPASQWRTVTAAGTFIPEQQAYVRLRQFNGQDAREIVVPFRLTDGSRILVDRGYLLTLEITKGGLPPDLPAGEVNITGRVSADQPDPSHRPEQRVGDRREVYGIDSATLLGARAGARIGFIQLTSTSPGVLTEIGVPDRDDGPFLSYALQWCVFGAVALLSIGFFAYREVTDADEGGPGRVDPAVDEQLDPAASSGSGLGSGPSKRAKFDKTDLYD